jgi:hypothetical protein
MLNLLCRLKFKLSGLYGSGHKGSFSFGTVGDKKVVAMQGRFHLKVTP